MERSERLTYRDPEGSRHYWVSGLRGPGQRWRDQDRVTEKVAGTPQVRDNISVPSPHQGLARTNSVHPLVL